MKEGWKYVKLGDAIDNLRTGLNPRTHFKLNTPDANGYYITVRELKGWKFKADEKTDRINEAAIKRINERSKLKVGDVLYSGTGTIGNTAIVNEEPTWWGIKEGVYAITPKRELYSNYLIYVLLALKDIIMSKASGTTVKSIPMRELIQIQIPLPPLSEQESIVTYLDTSFAKIDAIKANAEKELEEAKKLFAATLNEAMTPKEGWVEKTFGDVCSYNKNNGLHKGTKYVGLEHIEQNTGRLLGIINSDSVLSNTFAFSTGDVLYGRLRPYLKKVIVADFEGCCSTEIFPIQSELIIPHFLKFWFLTDEITNKINVTAAGCRMPRGNMNEVLKFSISFPSRTDQQTIVTHLDTLSEKVRQLQSNYEKISSECDALKQAILRDTFE